MNCVFFRSVLLTGLCNSMSSLFLSNFVVINSFHSKKTKIQSNNLAPSILERLMPITTEDEPEDVDDEAPSRVCFFFPLLVIFIKFTHLILVCSPNY
jgi:hypothetical protein